MYMKLFIDDIRQPPDDSWSLANDVSQAIRYICQFGESITHISIDHDISFEITMNGVSRPFPSPDTFQCVADYIALYYTLHNAPETPFPKIVIHSSNPAGADRIKAILASQGIPSVYIPYKPASRS